MHKVTFTLLIIGGINMLLEVFGYGLSNWLRGMPSLVNLIFVLVGLSALYEAFSHKNTCKHCVPGSNQSQPAQPMQS